MVEKCSFTFTTNVSREGYINKTDASACLSKAGSKAIGRNKMAFDEKTVTVDEFLNYAVNGHAFCPLYSFDENQKYYIENSKHQVYLSYPTYKTGDNIGAMKISFKQDKFFKSTQTVYVDVDNTHFDSVPDYIDSLQYKPTCVYMSFSDGKEKNGITSRRFHLVYVFDTQLNKEQFINAAYTLTSTISTDTNEPISDDCGNRLSQYMNGCYGNFETYNTNTIYSYNDILTINTNNNYYNNIYINREDNNAEHTHITIVESENEIHPDESLCSKRLIADMERLDYDTFMKYNRHKYRKFYRHENDNWIDGLYQYVDNDYFSLFFNINPLKDGNHRRKRLFERICLRRVIEPSVDCDTLLFNAYEDRYKFFDNSDGVLSIGCLVRNVERAMKLSIDDIKNMYTSSIGFLKSLRPKSNIIFKPHTPQEVRNKTIGRILKELKYNEISKIYNTSLSIGDNLQLLNDNGVDIGKDALYAYCKEYCIQTNPNKLSDDELLTIIDVNISSRQNLQILKDSGIKVGITRVNKLLNIKRNTLCQ